MLQVTFVISPVLTYWMIAEHLHKIKLELAFVSAAKILDIQRKRLFYRKYPNSFKRSYTWFLCTIGKIEKLFWVHLATLLKIFSSFCGLHFLQSGCLLSSMHNSVLIWIIKHIRYLSYEHRSIAGEKINSGQRLLLYFLCRREEICKIQLYFPCFYVMSCSFPWC